MRYTGFTALAIAAFATAAFAHSGVQNPAVKARMDLMVKVKEATGILGGMSKGAVPFDAAKAEAARTALAGHTAQIPALFEAPESDPKTEALPTIWTDWDGFIGATQAMERAVAAMDTSSLKTVRAGMGKLGKSCAACHEAYRIDK